MTKKMGKRRKLFAGKERASQNVDGTRKSEKPREASRQHSQAKKEKRPQDEGKKIWKIYLEKESIVQIMVNSLGSDHKAGKWDMTLETKAWQLTFK